MTSNPMLRPGVIENVMLESRPMTIQGAVNKTIILALIVVLIVCFSWSICAQGYTDRAMLLITVGSVAGLILAFVSFFNPQASKYTAPAYAVCEGFVIGGISFAYNSLCDGIVVNALGITLLALFTMLFFYKTGIIKATPVFKQVVFISTASIAIFYLAGFIGALLGHPMTIFNGGSIGIGVSVVICIIAALNFILDFDFTHTLEERHAPSYFEWYCGLSLLITVVWLYLEILRLLAQLNRRN